MTNPRRQGDAGVTLIEVLVAIVIMGIAFVALLLGMQSGILAADAHRKQADTSQVLVSASERVKSDATVYQNCALAGNATYTAAAQAVTPVPAGWSNLNSVTITSVQYWNGLAFQSANCFDKYSNVVHVQLIELQAVSPDGKATQRLSTIKRDPYIS